MKKSAEPTVLDHCIELYIPTQCRCGLQLPDDVREEVLLESQKKITNWFGGSTLKTDRCKGFWPSDSGNIAEEEVDVIHAYTDINNLNEHRDELMAHAARIANQLTQESVACRIDSKFLVLPSTEDVKPHRCANGSAPHAIPEPVSADAIAKMKSLQAALLRLKGVRDVRDLFCNVLHYDFKDDQLPAHTWPESVIECLAPGSAPQIVADKNGFKIIYLKLAKDSLRKSFERKIVQRIIKDDPSLRGLIVVSDIEAKQWELVNVKVDPKSEKKSSVLFRRMRVGPGQESRTAVERLATVDTELFADDVTAAEIQDKQDEAFDVESVSKEFFNEISNWYFWALSQVEFPTATENNDEKHRATSLIRFLTRIIFCWFLKEKGLIPGSLFHEKDLADILVDLDPDSCTYHQGILQNLFFATLNQRMGKDSKGKPYRAFAKGEGFLENKSTYGIDTLYRYEEHFQYSDKAIGHFADIPFLNGGLFECLDSTDEDTGKKLYVDGFSRNMKKRARIPNRLFFSGDQTVDLSGVYGDTGRRNAKVRGLLRILHAYNFTIEENTPIDEEIALDPELLGKVFENLLASYNEETKTTARKQTGSFYTPRPIVEYMVDESLKALLCGTLTKLGHKEEEAREQLDLLLGYTDEEPSFSEEEINALLEAIHTCKILDPACGSGAFPIGMLQKLVHVVHKLDRGNTRWKQLQIDQASKISDSSARDAAIKAIEKDFEENGDDYGRKLYLIENCLYGVDIQPIAIQISKLRFFISLICDQKTNRDKAKNHGIRALPNLETKFVVADTLFGLPEMDQMDLVDPRVNQIEAEIELLYHRHFSIQRRDQKLAIQMKLIELRKELGQVLAQSLGSSAKAQHIADWDPFDSQSTSDFFDPHWMFGRALGEGFNIVTGNPPYQSAIEHKKTKGKEYRDQVKDLFDSATGTWDLYVPFFEAGIDFLHPSGILSYISPNKYLSGSYGKGLRQYILNNCRILSLTDVSHLPVFESASVYPVISVLQKDSHKDKYLLNLNLPKSRSSNFTKIDYSDSQQSSDALEFLPENLWGFLLSPRLEILKSLLENCDILGSVARVCATTTAAEADNLGETLLSAPASGWRTLNTGTVDPFCNKWEYQPLRHQGESIVKPILPDGPLVSDNRRNLYSSPKLIFAKMALHLEAFVDLSGEYAALNCNCASNPKGNWSLLSLASILHSSVVAFAYKQYFDGLKMSGGYLPFQAPQLKLIPVPKVGAPECAILDTIGSLQVLTVSKAKSDEMISHLIRDVADACIMECYFREHMAERDLLLIEEITPYLDGYDRGASEKEQNDFLEHFHRTLNAKGSKVRDRLNRICKNSPDLLAVIKEEGKV
jgi:adenine-specific DNA-methyltransferase